MSWLRRKWAAFYERFISLHGTPSSIARAFSVGIWIAWFPIIGTHSVMSALGGLIFRVNLPAVYLGSWLCNPLTIPPMLYLDYELGSMLVGGANLGQSSFSDLTFRDMLTLGWDVLAPMIVGGAILGTVSAAAAYYPIKTAVIRVRRRIHHEPPEPPE